MKSYIGLACACAVLAGCTAPMPVSVRGEAVVSGAKGGTGALVEPDPFSQATQGVSKEQFQFRTPNGDPVPGVRVVVGNQVLRSDGQGVIALPAELLKNELVMTAKVEAKGFVPGIYNLQGGRALVLQPVDTNRTPISAAQGGSVRNADGTMEVIFPPGALSKDAKVAVTRTYHDGFSPNILLPEYLSVNRFEGYQPDLTLDDLPDGPPQEVSFGEAAPLGSYGYSFDLDGASLTPGAAVRVLFKVEPRLAAVLEEQDYNFKEDGLQKDSNGNWWFSMVQQGAPLQRLASGTAKYSLLKKTGGGGGGGGKGGGGGGGGGAKSSGGGGGGGGGAKSSGGGGGGGGGGGAAKSNPPSSSGIPKSAVPDGASFTKQGNQMVITVGSKAEAKELLKSLGGKVDSKQELGKNAVKDSVDKSKGLVGGFKVHGDSLNNAHCIYIAWPDKKPANKGPNPTAPLPGTPTAPVPKAPTAGIPSGGVTGGGGIPSGGGGGGGSTSNWAPPPSTTVTTNAWVTGAVAVNVRWSSDDTSLDGKPVSGALVSFSHPGTVTDPATTSDYTDADGTAVGWGAEYAPGSATVSYPPQPSVIGTATAYYVDYNTYSLFLLKNKPKLSLSFTPNGVSAPGNYALPTTLGNFSVPAPNPTVITPTLPTDKDNVVFQAYGGLQPSSDQWMEFESQKYTVAWNDESTIPINMWTSKQVGTTLRYVSDDEGAPADQKPAALWNGQPVTGAGITFGHAVSGFSGKPVGRDQLSFVGVGEASTWGLAGAVSTVTASRPSATAIPFTGSKEYTVAGSTFVTDLTANLPKVRLPIIGDEDALTNLVMTYTLDGVAKTMRLPAPVGGVITFSLPIEEAVNQPALHTFQLKDIQVDGLSDWRVFQADGSLGFPELKDQARNTDTKYPDLELVANGAK